MESTDKINDPSNVPGRRESIGGSNIADVATAKDSLGFDVYVEALGAFLANEETSGPLALSVEGEWGSGKSSFMLQLKKFLEGMSGIKTIWFNAWRHDNEEALWAAFALQFVQELSRNLDSRWQRIRANWKLMLDRFDWRSGWIDLTKTILSIILWIGIAVAIWVLGIDVLEDIGIKEDLSETIGIILGSVGTLGVLQRLFLTIRDTVDIVGNPLRFNLKKHIQNPNYAERIEFIEQFHNDFNKIIDAYIQDEKVFVFIDDLDRCKVPIAADMMQAMNLMIGEDKRLIFIIGMDRQKIAAGLAVKFEKLLPYIQLDHVTDFEKDKRRVGIRFGYDYIEKFIQLPFRVPSPRPEMIDNLYKSSKKEEGTPELNGEEKKEGFWSKVKRWITRGKPEDENAAEPENEENIREEEVIKRKWDQFALEVADDSQAVKDLVVSLAGFLDYNPRRIKQFINSFRLKAYIAYNTGQFNPPVDAEDVQALTFEQLAKFVTLELRWPLLLANIEENNELLGRLSHYAEARKNNPDEIRLYPEGSPLEELWRNDTELMELLALKATPSSESDENKYYTDYSLTNLDVKSLLKISAKVTPETAMEEDTFRKESYTEESSQASKADNFAGDYLLITRSANLKTSPDDKGEIMARLSKGDRLDLLDNGNQINGYYHAVTSEGTMGWIYRTSVRRYAPEYK